MRKKLLSLIILLVSIFNYAQTTVAIPDDAFEAYLETIYAANIVADGSTTDGSITFTDIDLVTDINFSESGSDYYSLVTTVTDLTGIKEFPRLKNLYCGNNALTGTLDVSDLAYLTNFYCYNNPSLTSLDISGCKQIYHIKAYQCAFTSLDFSLATTQATVPTRLRYVYVNDNALTDIDFSGYTAIFRFDAFNNNLTSIDISELSTLTYLRVQNNDLRGHLDVSQNLGLEKLGTYNNDNLNSINLGAIPYTVFSYFKISASDLLKTVYSDNPSDFEIGGALDTAIGSNYSVDAFTEFKLSSLFTSWAGATDTDWGTASNWSNGLPTNTIDVTIPNGVTNYPTIDSNVETKNLILNEGATININAAKSLTVKGDFSNSSLVTIQSGGSLIADGDVTGTGNTSYNLSITDNNWHLISSPVVGEGYDDAWVAVNNIASGAVSTSNRGIAMYQNGTLDETTGPWTYLQNGGSGTFENGIGYSLKRTGTGNYTFTGTFPSEDVSSTITQDVSNWNLIGNPYPSYVDVAEFISANTANLGGAFQSIYVWNAATSSYDDLTTGYVYPGQAFFVNSNVTSGNVSFTEAMQTHQTAAIFYRTESVSSIDVVLSNGTSTKSTQINYLADKTTGLNPGFDIGMFDGVDSDIRIYSHLISDNKGISFRRQALPDNDFENLIIPVGVKANPNEEITFTVNTQSLPEAINVYLEDRFLNSFTLLNEANASYKTTLANDSKETGRFYIHTSSKVLNTNSEVLNSVSIFKKNNNELRIAGLQMGNTSVRIFNVLGKQVLQESFSTNDVKDITLPKLPSGIYIVKLQNATGNLSKKIILE